MRKLSIIIVLALAITMAFAGTAYANFAIHGGYETDTDACAGCHRAHTSFSTATRTADEWGTQSSALLVSDASTVEEFCYACHGDGAPGASTNVEMGVFDAGPSGEDLQVAGVDNNGGVVIEYETNSTIGAALNGGGFASVSDGAGGFNAATSMHNMNSNGTVDPMWGVGQSASAGTPGFTCTSCHDPHGSTNYRLLKDNLKFNGADNVVGGYNADGSIASYAPFVISYEEGYPTTGWLRGADGGDVQMANYVPNYTNEEYAYQPELADGTERSISGWCVGCHEAYIIRNEDADFDGVLDAGDSTYEYPVVDATAWSGGARTVGEFDANGDADPIGAMSRHRHPVNLPLDAGIGANKSLAVDVRTNAALPLEVNMAYAQARGTYDENDYFGCLTCHVAHGTSAAMEGWAESEYVLDDDDADGESLPIDWYPRLAPGKGGVNPNFTSALLRTDNRGVCERCHAK